MGSDGSVKRVRILFSGRVQRVGFRYTVCGIATPFDISGYVRNRSDGDVELVAEGSERELIGFIEEIRNSRLKNHIAGEKLSWTAATGEYRKFRISD